MSLKFEDFSTDVFPRDYKRYHMLLIGDSESGKSYYTKYIAFNIKKSMIRGGCDPDHCPIHVFCGDKSINNWNTPDSSGQLVPVDNVYSVWNSDKRNKFLDDAKKHKSPTFSGGRGLVIFDDCKSFIDFHHNNEFKDWVRTLRNIGSQMIVMGHSPNDVPPLFRRGNLKHIILFHNSNRDTISKLAYEYLSNDKDLLIDLMTKVKKYCVIKINLDKQTIGIHSAPPPSVLGLKTYGLQDDDISDDEDENGGVGDKSIRSSTGMTGVGAINAGDVNVNGVYNDTSDRSIKLMLNQKQLQSNYQIEEQKKLLSARLNNEKTIYEHKVKMTLLEQKNELLGLIMKPMLYGEERYRAAMLLSQIMRNNRINSDNMFSNGYDVDFVNMYYPEIEYVGKDRGTDILTNYSDLAISTISGDSKGIASSILGHIINPVSKFLKIENKFKKKDYKSIIRKLIIHRQDRYKGICHSSDEKSIKINMKLNYPSYSHNIDEIPIYILINNFLSKNYPSDLAGEDNFYSKLVQNTKKLIVNRSNRDKFIICKSDAEKIIRSFRKFDLSVNAKNLPKNILILFKECYPSEYKYEFENLSKIYSATSSTTISSTASSDIALLN